MIKFLLPLALLPCVLLNPSRLAAQSMALDGIGVGDGLTITGGGGPPSAAVELFRNGRSLGSTVTTAGGQFAFTHISAAANDSFEAAVGQVWNFDSGSEGWSGNPGDASLISAGIWKQTESSNASDMGFTIYGDQLVKTKARALEIRMRFQGAGVHPSSLILRTAGPDGVSGTADDTVSYLINTLTLQHNVAFQTHVLDLGTDHAGQATNWRDGHLPISISLFVNGTNAGNTLEVDFIRLTESMRWEFADAADLAEWTPNANTSISNNGNGLLGMQAKAAGGAAMVRPFRPIGSSHFSRLETRLRQVTSQQPNLLQWNYLSNPAAYGSGGFQVAGLPANGEFSVVEINLQGSPTYGLPWGAGGAATLNVSGGDAFQALFANAPGQYAEVDYIRLHPAVRYGPSQPVVASGAPTPPSYYVSSSSGSDLNSGRSAGAPWKSFANLNGLNLGQGTTVFLKRGDTWTNSKLVLAGKGAPGSPVTITAYGEGARPRITGINLTTEPCIVWNNPSHVRIDSMDCRDAKVGLYLRFTGGNTDGTGPMFRNTGVSISNCHFKNMDEVWSDGSGNISVPPPYELSWGAGIWIGGSIPAPAGGPWPSESTPILDDLSVTHCGFEQVSTGVGMNFYFPSVYHKSRFTNFRFEDSWVTGCENGSMALFYVDGGHARRVDTWSGGSGFYGTGTTAGFIQHMQNFAIDDCQFAFNKRNSTGNDGTGFDYEGNTANVAFTHNVIHDNDGSGMLLINSVAGNSGFNMSHNTFWNNCRNPKESGQNNEMRASSGNSGTYTNNGIYRGGATPTGTPVIYNNQARWEAYTGGAANRTTTPYSAVAGRPLGWSFAMNGQGWGGANQWSGFGWSGGSLVGTSSGNDPFVESPATWVNTRERRWVWVRMSQTAGSSAQIFFETETSAGYSEDKSVLFPVVADGVMRDYVVDLGQSTNYKGVVTRWRLDPTNAAGSQMAIERFDSMLQPYLASVVPVASNIMDVRFNQAMHPDGGVFNPANYQLGGIGQGTAAGQPSSVSLISTSSGPVYRLVWHSGHTNGLGGVLSAFNSLDARGNPMWSGSQLAMTTIPKSEADSDGDGMPDGWENAAGLDPESDEDALTDQDGDGQANVAEYQADTNPSDATSRFQIKRLENPGPGYVSIVWASRPGLTYHVEASDSLLAGSWASLNPLPIVASSVETRWDAPADGTRRFYRVRVFRPNPLITANP